MGTASTTPGEPGVSGWNTPLSFGWLLTSGHRHQFDGVLDLAFGALPRTPNLTLACWTVDVQRLELDRIGKFTNLTVDPRTREVKRKSASR
jgi:hypothetical protein